MQAYEHPGIQAWQGEHGISVMRLHYEADEAKGQGDKTFVPEVNKHLSPWALNEYRNMTNPANYLQEYEIDAEATLGALLYQLDEEASVEKSFPIPENWTRRMSLDPHPGKPHAFLWCATDPWGDRWYYREFWPSKIAFRYEYVGGPKLGKLGLCVADDNRLSIREYVEIVHWLESNKNPENVNKDGQGFDEKIYQRVIDYAARAFGKGTNDDPEQLNFQQRYEMHMEKLKVKRPFFDDAKKDHDAGIAVVSEALKPREVMGNDGNFRKRARAHFFADRVPETIYQLKNARLQQLSPVQALSKDPTGLPVDVRLHQIDNLRYIEMANPIYIKPQVKRPSPSPIYPGTSY